MNRLTGLGATIATRLLIVVEGLVALVRLIGMVAAALPGDSAATASRIGAALTGADGQRVVFAVLRAFLPNIAISTKLITAYDNTGSAVVTRYDHVKEVLRRDADFEVVYGPRMETITGGANFFLGMQDSPAYTRDVSNMRLVVRRDDVPAVVLPFVAERAASLVRALPGRIDVPQDLTLRVPAQLLGAYFGTPGPSEADMIAWTTLLFWYLFIDLKPDASLDARALDAAARYRAYLDETILARKAHPTEHDDVLNRCLALQRAGVPGMDDLGIRNNLIGLVIGAVPTISKAAVQALDQLLQRPAVLARAQLAAQNNDDATLGRYVFEALRFNPVNPAIYRRATRTTVIAPNTLRALTVPKGTMVFASNLSAMFDRLKIGHPGDFRINRPWESYILWGDGMHACFGAHINRAVIPAILKPLLARRRLQRVPGGAGQIDTEGTPFPVHLWLQFEPG